MTRGRMFTGTLFDMLINIATEAAEKHRLWGTRCVRCGSLYEDHTYHGDRCPHQGGECTGQIFKAMQFGVREDA